MKKKLDESVIEMVSYRQKMNTKRDTEARVENRTRDVREGGESGLGL